jgi:hypothetical protein
MLSNLKFQKLTQSLKDYKKNFLDKPLGDLDESGTRLLINHFLTEILGYKTLEDIKTEYMIKGTYADYVIQIAGEKHFLVEVKALSLNLSDKHLRQSINYGANEGIDWVLLTNGKEFQLYRVIFEKPISQELVFSLNLSDLSNLKSISEQLQFLHKDIVLKGGLEVLWNRNTALSPKHLTKILFSTEVVSFVQKELKKKFNIKFDDAHIEKALKRIAIERIEINEFKSLQKKERKKRMASDKLNSDNPEVNHSSEEQISS